MSLIHCFSLVLMSWSDLRHMVDSYVLIKELYLADLSFLLYVRLVCLMRWKLLRRVYLRLNQLMVSYYVLLNFIGAKFWLTLYRRGVLVLLPRSEHLLRHIWLRLLLI
jgi:hypothetical protein